MNHRERVKAILNYERYDRMPVVHFGYWSDTLHKWVREGHLCPEDIEGYGDGNQTDHRLDQKIGWDFNWAGFFSPNSGLFPCFERKVLELLPDGRQKALNPEGVVVLEKPGTTSIPSEVDHLLKTRADWEEHYRHRLQWDPARVLEAPVHADDLQVPFGRGGLEYLRREDRARPCGLYCGSLFGIIRNILGVTGISYLYAEDPDLYEEIINTVGELVYRCTAFVLERVDTFDFGHFWEDICFKNGPLVIPSVFDALVGPHYNRITGLFARHGITLVSLDCDGCIDALIPTWLHNGVNTMFPIEVGTWQASIAPWRQRYGRALRGVGGMNKNVFARDFAAVDVEIERLKALVDLGGYIPCPDHRIAPDANWDTVRYYCDRMREVMNEG
ncbi:MAG: hypothetical protein BWX80_00592 [Candidatus Hydrogenedentes bacterium ADurb.Bin101]|nr:MAG: hypothetical protein BWX80_00592 [Candidatus Hydrogenedentes bacterium ADurb.Bin101]